MTTTDLAIEIATPLGWSPHDGSFAEQIAEALLAKYKLEPKEE